jgi:hypothetical protein
VIKWHCPECQGTTGVSGVIEHCAPDTEALRKAALTSASTEKPRRLDNNNTTNGLLSYFLTSNVNLLRLEGFAIGFRLCNRCGPYNMALLLPLVGGLDTALVL